METTIMENQMEEMENEMETQVIWGELLYWGNPSISYIYIYIYVYIYPLW